MDTESVPTRQPFFPSCCPPSPRTPPGLCGHAASLGLHELCGGRRLRHADRYRFRQECHPHQGVVPPCWQGGLGGCWAQLLRTNFWPVLSSAGPGAGLTTALLPSNTFMWPTWHARTSASCGRNTRSTFGKCCHELPVTHWLGLLRRSLTRPPAPQEHRHHRCLLCTSCRAAGDHISDGEETWTSPPFPFPARFLDHPRQNLHLGLWNQHWPGVSSLDLNPNPDSHTAE